MKKGKISEIFLFLLPLLLIILLVTMLTNSIRNFFNTNSSTPESYLTSSTSPTGEYYVEAYRTNPPATVDFSIRVYLVVEDEKDCFYNGYHESDVTITWVSDHVISINGRELDLSKGKTYDWRAAP